MPCVRLNSSDDHRFTSRDHALARAVAKYARAFPTISSGLRPEQDPLSSSAQPRQPAHEFRTTSPPGFSEGNHDRTKVTGPAVCARRRHARPQSQKPSGRLAPRCPEGTEIRCMRVKITLDVLPWRVACACGIRTTTSVRLRIMLRSFSGVDTGHRP
ncbi:hypothetical protein PHLGIDRAFT_188844 [Phlebiopsis gigantea 11061_1 CR5-6]|uniref:Uncharacterized protein n=1 Tax=Phlebiopsis gigantea (strain 11061_1 CR5-6) TaxID=745531 RepID=A0A0C3NIA8_PHLG1|nr:hypothetical protein PHLGIDRAFT_188844 [Phlebiopsis gigantea 11061_1 CR5-6]